MPVLADMLLEGAQAQKRAIELLVRLTGENYLKGGKSSDVETARQAYKKWFARRGGEED